MSTNASSAYSRFAPTCASSARSIACALLVIIGIALAPAVLRAQPCSLSPAAFCETFESGPTPLQDRGRGNELSRARFSTTRYAPSLSSGNGVTFCAWEAELGLIFANGLDQ